MSDRDQVMQQAVDGLKLFSEQAAPKVMIGFDGFVDSIIDVVDKRTSAEDYTTIPTIEMLGNRFVEAAGQSSNFELVTKLRKLGGNGPIMANAMACGHTDVTFIGCLGKEAIDPVFADLAQKAEVHSIENPGATDALEFSDGKLMLGKYDHIAALSIDQVLDAIGTESFAQLVARSSLISVVNWVMMPSSETIWTYLADELLPTLDPEAGGQRRKVFFDLCDPAKRTDEDLDRALKLMGRVGQHSDVVFGMNLAEGEDVCRVLNLPTPEDDNQEIVEAAKNIREKLGIACAVIHPRRGAGAAMVDAEDRSSVQSAWFDGPFVQHPKLSTGAGDNFNAGFCLGLLAQLSIDQALCTGTATSGYYVRNAKSPSLAELIEFIETLPPTE